MTVNNGAISIPYAISKLIRILSHGKCKEADIKTNQEGSICREMEKEKMKPVQGTQRRIGEKYSLWPYSQTQNS